MAVLSVRDLTKSFVPPRVVVDHVSFDLEQGETLGILGVNGAGKTTTISMLTGLLTPTAGSITYFGKELGSNRSEILARVGTASAYAELPTKLTIWQNLDTFGRLFGLDRATRETRITLLLDKLDMLPMKNRRCAGLSAGETTRVILAKALLHDPAIVLLDEPTASLDVDIAKKIRAFLNERRGSGTSCIITSHNMQEMTELCDRILVLHGGHIIAVSTPTKLARSVQRTRVQL
ncbi:MAG: ABC transporter ATP-binding protein, partial [Candidatus Dependentiae bacterium]|nr:ABC transporter ATP-binding protein [Candidatus Dependentiae bacterium]